MPSMVVACHRLEVARRTPGVESRSRPAGRIPCITISLRPKSQRQRADALPFVDRTSSDALVTKMSSCAR